MLEVKLNNGKFLESVITVRELILLDSESPELHITVTNYADLVILYNLIKEEGALNRIVVSDELEDTQDLILEGYTKILSLERVFDTTDITVGSFRVNIRLTKE